MKSADLAIETVLEKILVDVHHIPEENPLKDVVCVLRDQRAEIMLRYRHRLLATLLLREIGSIAFQERAEMGLHRDTILEWIGWLCLPTGLPQQVEIAAELAQKWLRNTSAAPVPADYEHKRRAGYRP